MGKQLLVNEFIENYDKQGDRHWGFYDWFCDNRSLYSRGKKLVNRLKFLIENEIINGDTVYVFFKNNCPMVGSTYDDMRFSTLEGDVYLGGISPYSGHEATWGICEVWFVHPPETGKELEVLPFKDWGAFAWAVVNDEAVKVKLQNHFLHF